MRRALITVGFAMVAAASPLLAHHSWPVDTSKAVTVSGTVTSYEWGNPHVMMGLDVKADDGSTEKWNVGGPSTTRMEANGWDKTTLKPGDVITATGFRFSDGQKILRLEKIVMAGGKEMFLYGRR
ncbi:MAG TPA: DUF6152 family protein [Vicinamibacterales bacterium]|jgi:hypothetical protein|nr:DUF6152 family protein [Vicinamibacterales bacterium]